MATIIECTQCSKPATYSVQATEVAGQPHDGVVNYYCDEHYNEVVKELEA